MRNLVSTAASRQQASESDVPICLFSVDYEGQIVYTSSAEGLVSVHNGRDAQGSAFIDIRGDLSPGAEVTCFSYVPESAALCIGATSGHLLMVNCETCEVEEVGQLEGGVAALEWAPDGETLCIVTGAGQMLLMTKEWDVLREVSLLEEHQTGGSGNKRHPLLSATQIAITWRGDAKYFATLLQSPAPDIASSLCHQPSNEATSWSAAAASNDEERGTSPEDSNPTGRNATEVAVAGGTSLCIWRRDGCELHARGEAVAQLLPIAAWQPNGRHLYVGQATLEGPRVLLFETNGLQHGGLGLRSTGELEALTWSADSNTLVTVMRHLAKAPDLEGRLVQLWRRSNWQWYLKHEMRFTGSQGGVLATWDALEPSTLHLCSGTGRKMRHVFGQQYSASACGTVAVIDGATVMVTPLQHEVVPPPMCSVVAACPSPVISVSFRGGGKDGRPEELAALCSDDSVAVFRAPGGSYWGASHDSEGADDGDDGAEDIQPSMAPVSVTPFESGAALVRQVVWADGGERVLLVCTPPPQDRPSGTTAAPSVDCLRALDLQTGSLSDGVRLPGGGGVLCALPASEDAPAVVQSASGSLFLWHDGHVTTADSGHFPEPCPVIAHTPPSALDLGPAVIGLSAAGRLYWGNRPIATATAVTSFTVRGEGPGGAFLMFTERSGLMRTLPFGSLSSVELPASCRPTDPRPIGLLNGTVEDGGVEAAVPYGASSGRGGSLATMLQAMRPTSANSVSGGITERAYEQGGVLVTAPPGGSSTAILQMPRGNLEVVQPRVLCLAAIAEALQAGEYSAAWDAAVVARVDLNCLVDFQWPSFPAAAAEFLAAVPAPADVADLLAALAPDDCTAAGAIYAGMADLPRSIPQEEGAPRDSADATGAFERPGLPGTAAASAAAAVDSGAPSEPAADGGKVARVCGALRGAMQAAGAAKYLKPMLTSLAKVGRLADALAMVKDLKEAELAGSGPPSLGSGGRSPPTAEEGLNHLLLSTDVETLYRCALGQYELGVAYMIISASQRDPGEYMLQLQRFSGAGSVLRQRHAVDIHLGRYTHAVQNLIDDGSFEEALALARQKDLLRELLAVLDQRAQHQQAKGTEGQQVSPEAGMWRTETLAAFGETLSGHSQHEDAAMAYVAAGRLEDALQSYRAAGCFQMALALAGRLEWSFESRAKLAAEIAIEVAASGQLREAAALELQFDGSVSQAVTWLLQGQAWREALHVVYRRGQPHLVAELVEPSAVEAAMVGTAEAHADRARVSKYVSRYREVQGKRAALQAAVNAADANAPGGIRSSPDDDSDSGSNSAVSDLSAYTTATGTTASSVTPSGRSISTKAARKAAARSRQKAKKGARIRQGSPLEEAALAEHLASLAPRKETMSDACQLAEVLVVLGHFAAATALQAALEVLVADQKEAADHVKAHPPAEQQPQSPPPARSNKPDVDSWTWQCLRTVATEPVLPLPDNGNVHGES